MTKYRIVSDGYAEMLEYLKTYKCSFFFWKWELQKWTRVWWPKYDKVRGRDESCVFPEYDLHVSMYNNNLKKFVEMWPNIDEYFTWATTEQKRLEQLATDYWQNHEKKKKTIKYL
jgi:hypothetical protein